MQGDVVSEVNDVLRDFDVLVTDYSSIYYDWLMLDRPAVFLPYDLANYREAPGFYIPFNEIVGGPISETQAAFIEALSEAFSSDDSFGEQRGRVQKLVYCDVDGASTERVLKFLADDLG